MKSKTKTDKKRRRVSMNDEVTVYPIPIIPKKIPNQLPPRVSNRWRNLQPQLTATIDNIEEFVELVNGSAPASKKKRVAAKGVNKKKNGGKKGR